MKLSTQHRSVVILLLVAGGTAAYVMLLFLPTQRSINETKAQTLESQTFVVQSQQLNQTLKEVESELARARDYRRTWQEAAPRPAQVAHTFGRITKHAADTGVSTRKFDPQPGKPLETVTRVPVSLGVEGDYRSVCEFLGRLEAMPESIWLEDVRLSRAARGEGLIECELTLAVFADNQGISD